MFLKVVVLGDEAAGGLPSFVHWVLSARAHGTKYVELDVLVCHPGFHCLQVWWRIHACEGCAVITR